MNAPRANPTLLPSIVSILKKYVMLFSVFVVLIWSLMNLLRFFSQFASKYNCSFYLSPRSTGYSKFPTSTIYLFRTNFNRFQHTTRIFALPRDEYTKLNIFLKLPVILIAMLNSFHHWVLWLTSNLQILFSFPYCFRRNGPCLCLVMGRYWYLLSYFLSHVKTSIGGRILWECTDRITRVIHSDIKAYI